jgi:phosphatidylinositol kinase/protein kinase (PI-3  family)
MTAMRRLRVNRYTLLSVLEPFLKDPVIDWKRHRGQQNKTYNTSMVAQHAGAPIHTNKQTKEAKRSIKVIEERLQGIYNLRNPNLKKYSRQNRAANQAEDQDDDDFSHLVPLPVEGQVQRMIREATSHENLVQLYVGWMPWV